MKILEIRSLTRVLMGLFIIVALLLFLIPIFYMITSAFKKPIETFAYPPVWIFRPVFDNFIYAFQKLKILNYMRNSIIVATTSALLALFVAFPAAYGLARIKFKGRNKLAIIFLMLQSIPTIAVVFAFFFLARSLSLIDTRILLIIAYLYWGVPYAIWQLRGYIMSIPIEIEEAALIDGCNQLLIPYIITLPLITPGLVATAILVFITFWNEYVLAFFLTLKDAVTLPVSTSLFMTHTEILWGPMFATATLSALPVMVFVLIIRKYFVRSLTYGAIK
mgnify:CR=1 FL=1